MLGSQISRLVPTFIFHLITLLMGTHILTWRILKLPHICLEFVFFAEIKRFLFYILDCT